MNRTQMLRTDDIRRLLEVKDFNKQKARRANSVNSDDSDRSDLSTKSMPQYSSYRALSGGLFGPFEKSPSRPGSRSGFLQLARRGSKTPDMSSNIPPHPSRLKTPLATPRSRGKGEGSSRPTSRTGSRGDDLVATPVRPGMNRENSASKLPVFRREASMPQIKRESSIPKIKRETTDFRRPASATPKHAVQATPRGSNAPIVIETTPKTVAQTKVSGRNISAKGTRSGISGISDAVMIGDRVSITGTIKKGIVQFVGETRFAKGVWAGVVLDDKTGKNDGSVAGVRYFSCPSLRGVFVKEDKLEKISDVRTPGFTPHGTAGDRKLSVSRNDSAMSSDSGVDDEQELTIGDCVKITSASGFKEGMLRFVGTTEFAKGTWCGVELRDPTGKNDGAVAGTRYFQCEPKYGLFAQINKVKKIPTPESELKNQSPLTSIALAKHNAEVESERHTIPPSDIITSNLDSDTESALQAVDAALLNESISSPSPSEDDSPRVDVDSVEQSKKIANLQRQVSDQDDKLKSLYADQEKEEFQRRVIVEKVEHHEKVLREHQENAIRLQGQVGALEREKLNLENQLKDTNQKNEDLQFQLEEQLLLSDEKRPSNEDLEKVLGLEKQLKEKEAEVEAYQAKLEKLKSENEEEVFRLLEKDTQMEGKEKEVEKLQDLLKVTKENESLLNDEVTALKKQIQDFRDLQSSVSDAERKSSDLRIEFENKLLDRDRKVTDLQDELQGSRNKLTKLQTDLNERDNKISEMEFQVTKNREELNESVESKGSLNKQILELNNELDGKRKEIHALNAETEHLKHDHLDLKAKLEVAESRNTQMIDDKKKLEEDILKVSKNSGDNAQQLVYLNEQIQSKNGEIASLQDKQSTLVAENNKLQQAMTDFKEKVDKEKAAYEKEKTEENQKLRDSIVVMEDHFKKIKVKNEEVELSAQKEKLELQKSSNEINNLSQLNKAKDDELLNLKKELEELSLKMQNVTKTADNQWNELDSAKQALQVSKNRLEEKNSEAEKLTNEINLMKKQNENINEELTNLRIERTNIEKRLNCMTQEKTSVENDRNAITKANEEVLNRLNNIIKEKETVEKKNDNLEKEKLEIANENSKLKDELLSTVSNSENYKEQLNEYQQKLTADSSSIENIQNELMSTKAEFETINNQSKQLETERDNLHSQNEKLVNDIKQKNEREDEQKKETLLLRDQLKQSLAREQTIRTKLDTERIQLQEQIETSISSVRSMDDELQNLRHKVNDLEAKNAMLEARQQSHVKNGESKVSSVEYGLLKTEMEQIKFTKDEKEQEVNFLNTIIVDLQRKNKEQDAKIKILTYGDDIEDMSTSGINDTMSPAKPGLRVRLFCDICDVFDEHDTEDCPLQSSDTGGSQHHGERGNERPYCTVCETFGHTAENCDDEEMF